MNSDCSAADDFSRYSVDANYVPAYTVSPHKPSQYIYILKMCTGMGFPVRMGIPWNSHENKNEKQISTGMGMGMISVGVGMLENALRKNSH